MDFWDLTKLLFRRWYFMVPMLAVSVAAAVFVGSTVKPDYEGTANSQLIPPNLTEADAKAGVTNQWLNLGINALAQAAIVTLQGKAVVEELESDGLSTNFTIEKSPYDPLITITVTGDSEKQTVDTAQRIAQLYSERIALLQKQQGVIDRLLISTKRLDRGDNLTTDSSKLKRALIAVLFAGVLMAAAFTIGMDAWLRRRARRRSIEDDNEAMDPGIAPVPVTPQPTEQPAAQAARNGSKPAVGLTFRPITSMDEQPQRVPELATGPESRRPSGSVPSPALSVEYRSASRRDDPPAAVAGNDDVTNLLDRVEDDHDEPTAALMPEDATIVLPLSHNRWAARDGSSKRR